MPVDPPSNHDPAAGHKPLANPGEGPLSSAGNRPLSSAGDGPLSSSGDTRQSLRPRIRVDLGHRAYDILIGHNLLATDASWISLVSGRQVAVVTNQVLARLHAPSLCAQLKSHVSKLIQIDLPDGERFKDWQHLQLIFDALLSHRFDRRCLLIAFGGGVVGDMTGFAAACYQRGVDFIQIPTTLLAQVDSSVGGKTGINHPAGKNMIGAFHQPKMVLADSAWLQTLPARELRAGLAEVIKHGAIADRHYLEQVLRDMPALLKADPEALAAAVARSCEIKAAVVGEDEREDDRRAILNFGHTFGHAIEAGLGYGACLHGEAVGIGMVMASDLSQRLGLLQADERALLLSVIQAAGLPMKAPAWSTADYLNWMSVDKKARAGRPRFVLLQGLGQAILTEVDEAVLDRCIKACIEETARER